jgi:hypothetical protein
MIRSAFQGIRLVTRPLAAPVAPILTAVALAAPTAILSLDHSLPAGACCTTYVPFVLAAAVLLGPVYASVVAIGSTALADALFMGPRYQLFESPMDRFGDVVSLASFALIIAGVWLFRKILAQDARPHLSRESASGIIFSLEGGVALVSWRGAGPPMRLGPEREVAEMMQDFLAQRELAKKLMQGSI